MKRIPLFYYVAMNNPRGGQSVLKHFNLTPANSPKSLARGLRYVIVKYGEDGLKEIVKAHPDTELILNANLSDNPSENIFIAEEKSNCGGDCKCREKKSSACGCSSSANGIENSLGVENQELLDEIKSLKTKDKIEEEKDSNKSLTKEEIANEVKKVIGESGNFLKDSLPYIVLIGVGAFLFTGILKK